MGQDVAMPTSQLHMVEFAVDAALLRELGERLVGRPHIALAELIKNSYDADATRVEVRFGNDWLEIADDGHGMTYDEFTRLWMRVGSPHKRGQAHSRIHKRPLTGSKGVGRLAAQLLGDSMSLRSAPWDGSETGVHSEVDWTQSVQDELLTSVRAGIEPVDAVAGLPRGAIHGTVIRIAHLRQSWGREEFRDLAREVWFLRSPFGAASDLGIGEDPGFEIALDAPTTAGEEAFDSQLDVALDLWESRLVGRLLTNNETNALTAPDGGWPTLRGDELRSGASDGEDLEVRESHTGDRENEWGMDVHARPRIVEFSLQRQGERSVRIERFEIERCAVERLDFDLRIYRFEGRQKYGVQVAEARSYLRKHGGVHIYDAGFHLPYYGGETDWLDIERTQSARKSNSPLLPAALRVKDGMNALPTNRRIFGVVEVDTALERRAATERMRADATSVGRTYSGEPGPHLQIQISRDRLVGNLAFENLRVAVRYALDVYAMDEAARKWSELTRARPSESAAIRAQRVEDVLERYRDVIPEQAYREIHSGVVDTVQSAKATDMTARQQTGLLASLATAGISALILEHELARQHESLTALVRRLRSGALVDGTAVADQLDQWLDQAEATRRLFLGLLDEEDRERRERMPARRLLLEVIRQVSPLNSRVVMDPGGLAQDVLLPPATYAEWTALFQNVLINAMNAMEATENPIIRLDSRRHGPTVSIAISDNGSGVDLATAVDLFEPFRRRTQIGRARLGRGGTGLGLTIVRLLAENADATAQFTPPVPGWSTTFVLSWEEGQQK